MIDTEKYRSYEDIIVTVEERIVTKEGERGPYGKLMGADPQREIHTGYSKMSQAIELMIRIMNGDGGGFDNCKKEVSKYGTVTLTRKVSEDEFADPLPHDAEDYYALETFNFYFECITKDTFNNKVWLENKIGIRDEMEFMNVLKEREKDIEFSIAKEFDAVTRDTICFKENVELSVQGSFGHVCEPRAYTAVTNYKRMEIAFMKDNLFVPVEDVLDIDNELRDALENPNSNGIYNSVKVKVIEKLYQALKEKYGRMESC